MVVGVTLLDIAGAKGVNNAQRRSDRPARTYRDRSGYPRGLENARGAARDFRTPPAMRAIPMAANTQRQAAAE
jgi:hypothetical protein